MKNRSAASSANAVLLAAFVCGVSQIVPSARSQALAPPRVDPLSSSTEFIPSQYSLNISGPNVTTSFNGVSAKSAIQMLADMGGYDFVYVQSNPLFSAASTPSSISTSDSLGGLPSNTDSSFSLSELSRQDEGDDQNLNLDSERLIYISLRDREYSSALNSVLLASGLQATFKDGIIYAGPDIDTKPIGDSISKTFRLNQITAKAAGEYLGNLGASVSITSTVTTSVSEGINSTQSVSGASTSSTTTASSTPESIIYGSKIGPLVGLFGVTDERLGSISLIGNPRLIDLAESYLLKIDAKQRQIVLDIQIIDFDLDNAFVSSNTSFFKRKSTYVISRNGQAEALFGDLFPPSDSQLRGVGAAPEPDAPFPSGAIRSDPEAPSNRIPNSDFSPDFVQNRLYSYIQAAITSEAAKVLASPSLVLMEDNLASGSTDGTDEVVEGIEDFQGGIGLSARPNEGRVVVGQSVVVNWTAEENSSVCEGELGNAGISLSAKVNKIDDYGFVTFQLTPQLSAITDTYSNPTCGGAIASVLSSRILQTGRVRVRSGETLLLTGVISDEDQAAITKWPLVGDIPVIGQFFRSTSRQRSKRELIITATPTILKAEY